MKELNATPIKNCKKCGFPKFKIHICNPLSKKERKIKKLKSLIKQDQDMLSKRFEILRKRLEKLELLNNR